MNRFGNRLTFILERLILRGTLSRLAVIAGAIVLISLTAGGFAYLSTGSFPNPWDAVWWAFLRLTDPGYLGDDEGVVLRSIATVVTILGYVVFMGSLIAIMTQWLNTTITRLESGLTPIAQRNHILILGWTNRTPSIIMDFLAGEGRVKRFLEVRKASRLRLVVLAEKVTPALVEDLKQRLGRRWSEGQIIFRTGSALQMDHLKRVDFLNAAAVVLPSDDYADDRGDADQRTIKILYSASVFHRNTSNDTLPLIVAEIEDARHIALAQRAYSGPTEILASDRIVCRILAQAIREPGVARLSRRLLNASGPQRLYVRRATGLAGRTFGEVRAAMERAIPLGIVHQDQGVFHPHLNPGDGFVLKPGDLVFSIAPSYECAAPQVGDLKQTGNSLSSPVRPTRRERSERRVLILGWNPHAIALIEEFREYTEESFVVDIISRVAGADRLQQIPDGNANVMIRQIEGEYVDPAQLRAHRPETYDSILLLASTLAGSESESDARTLLGYLVLEEIFGSSVTRPHIVLELMDPTNAELFRDREIELVIGPSLISYMLCQVAVRRELRAIFDQLFGAGGSEIVFRSPAEYGLGPERTTFAAMQAAACIRGEIALGLRLGAKGGPIRAEYVLNPGRASTFELGQSDTIIVLAES
ncbi:MAG: hypothetical protein R3F07_03425 [Opitutaceae bacterium]